MNNGTSGAGKKVDRSIYRDFMLQCTAWVFRREGHRRSVGKALGE